MLHQSSGPLPWLGPTLRDGRWLQNELLLRCCHPATLLLGYHELHLCLQGVICDFTLELVRIILVLLQPLLQGGQEILVFILRCLVRLLADVLVVVQGVLIFLVFP